MTTTVEESELMEIPTQRARAFVTKWRRLEAQRAKVDYETAQLEPRPEGRAGEMSLHDMYDRLEGYLRRDEERELNRGRNPSGTAR